jgi:uncharacterized damage-inducible protein DinB
MSDYCGCPLRGSEALKKAPCGAESLSDAAINSPCTVRNLSEGTQRMINRPAPLVEKCNNGARPFQKVTTKLICVLLAFAAIVSAQDQMANPLLGTSKAIFGISKNDVLGSVDKIPTNLWSFQPTTEVRTIGQLFAHIADGQYEFCGVAAEGKPVSKNIEKTAKSRDEIVAALNQAFAYCDSVYAKFTDAKAAERVKFFGMDITRLGALDFNVAHNMEHYGNLVTYMRLNNIVPPSSAPRTPAASATQK